MNDSSSSPNSSPSIVLLLALCQMFTFDVQYVEGGGLAQMHLELQCEAQMASQ